MLKTILDIQLNANVKARILNNDLSNEYVKANGKRVRSQVEIYNYLHNAVKSILPETEIKESLMPAVVYPGIM